MFPESSEQWPPSDELIERQEEWAAWYTDDVRELTEYYGQTRFNEQLDRFWSVARLRGQERDRTRPLHLPAVGDMAGKNAGLLFGETPRLEYDAEVESGRRLDQFIAESAMHSLLVEAADMASGLGGVYFKLDSDSDVSATPVLSVVKPTAAAPRFRRRRLYDVLFWRVLKIDGEYTYRLFEHRRVDDDGLVIEMRLYKGRGGKVGERVGLDSIEESRMLELETQTVLPGFNRLGVVYVPNNLPNKLMPGHAQGMSDGAPSLTLLDALDESWTSLMHDVRLGRGRTLIDKQYLEDTSTGRFDYFRATFVKLKANELSIDPANAKSAALPVQYAMRVEEHLRTCESLFANIVSRAGYAPQSFGLEIKGTAQSGTALRIRERASQLTRLRKSRYWTAALGDLFEQMQGFDVASGLSPRYAPQSVRVELQDSITQDLHEDSETIRNLRMAESISRDTAVRKLWPDWSEEQYAEELDRLSQEYETAPELEPL